MTEVLLSVQELAFSTPDKRLLSKDISFDLKSGEMLVVCGPNGVGKTTLLQVLLKQNKFYKGDFSWKVASKKIAYLPQLQNVSFHLPMTLMDILSLYSSKQDILKQVKRIGLLEERHLSLSWNTASGGERKRTLITRALLQNPQVLILDEPFNHLDQASKGVVGQTLASFLLEQPDERGILMVSHEHKRHSQMGELGLGVRDLVLRPYHA